MMIFGSALAPRLVWAGLAEYNDGCRCVHIRSDIHHDDFRLFFAEFAW